ncbi:MAG TPA: hybrid sensor histidine kinase/response regulator [bacterium]|nr:hybrid sensor histidine kinase/response regulator [bacterium]
MNNSDKPLEKRKLGRRQQARLLQNVMLPVAILFLIALSWHFVSRQNSVITATAIQVYQHTELEIVRAMARSVEQYVRHQIDHGQQRDVTQLEQEVFKLFIAPVRLLESGDAWIYAPDHVVFDLSSDFDDKYWGKSMPEIFEMQRHQGASHFEEMSAAVANAREGTGWYIWLPDKGKEIAAWTPVHAGDYVWTIGLSTPLPEILDSTGAAGQMRTAYFIMAVASIAILGLLLAWIRITLNRQRTEILTRGQRDLSLESSSAGTLDDILRLCLEGAIHVSGMDCGGIYLVNSKTGALELSFHTGLAEELVRKTKSFEKDTAYRRLVMSGKPMFYRFKDLDHRFHDAYDFDGLRATAIVPMLHKARVIGSLNVASHRCRKVRTWAHHALETIASQIGNLISRVSTEEILRESEERFRSVVSTAPDAIISINSTGEILLWNEGARVMFGYSADEIIGKSMLLLLPKNCREEMEKDFKKVLQQGKFTVMVRESEGVGKNGTAFPVELSVASWETREGICFTSIIRDITERRRILDEQRNLERRLDRAQRMESLGILAGGVAHDLNNLLNPLVGYPDLLLLKLPADDPLREILHRLKTSAKRAGAIVQDLLTLGRRGVYHMSPLNLNEIIGSFLESPAFIEQKIKYPETEISTELDPDLPLLSGSASHLSKAVMNLVFNGLEVMPDGGCLQISTYRHKFEKPNTGYESVEPGVYSVLKISDTGPGIEEQDLQHIFEPFYTKKEMGRSGSGLGLAVVYGVVHDHQGRIDVQTKLAKGTDFILYFPISHLQAQEEEKKPIDIHGSESVLVIDDLPEQRIMAEHLLTNLGYRVVSVDSGPAAIEYLSTNQVDILILDMILDKEYDGLRTYQEILKIKSPQKAIIVSGYSLNIGVRQAQALGAGQFVRKPYTLESIGRALRETLDQE